MKIFKKSVKYIALSMVYYYAVSGAAWNYLITVLPNSKDVHTEQIFYEEVQRVGVFINNFAVALAIFFTLITFFVYNHKDIGDYFEEKKRNKMNMSKINHLLKESK
jgi:hypothetical protein